MSLRVSRSNVRMAKTALFALITWAVSLLAAEGITRALYAWRGGLPPTRDPSLAEEWQWAERHLEAGAAVLPGIGVFDPLLGWRTPPNQQLDVRTNAAGMRANREVAREREPGRRRLLLVGDSYTFGAGVRSEETFARLLEDVHLADWDVLNLGVSGYGTDQQVLSFEYEGRRYHPDVVALGLFVRDYSRNLMRFRGYAKPRFVLDGAGGLRLEGSPVEPPAALLAAYRSGEREIRTESPSYLLELLLERFHALRLSQINSGSEGWRLLAALMERFARAVRESGAKPLLVLIPSRDALEEGGGRFAPLEALVEEHAAEIGLPYLSLTEPLRAHARPDDLVYQTKDRGGHFTATGHRLAAEAIHAFMRARGWTQEKKATPRASPEDS